jgi:hypothetical protein
MAKKYSSTQLNSMSIQQLQALDDGVMNPQDCLEEKQLLNDIRQLTSAQDISEVLHTYLLYNEPCIKIPVKSRLKSNTK